MSGFCIPKYALDELRAKLKSGEITPARLAKLTSQERRSALGFLGEESARKANALFEGKLLLKNQQKGMINWAEKILGDKPTLKKDTISKVERMSEILEPAEVEAFLNDLVAQKLGFQVSPKEAATLMELQRDVVAKEAKLTPQTKDYSPEAVEYGTSVAIFKQFVEDAKLADQTPLMKRLVNDKAGLAKEVAGASKSATASLDLSMFGIQGFKTLVTNPKIAIDVMRTVSKNIPKSLQKEDASLVAKALVYSRVNFRNGLDAKAKLATGALKEEAFPSSLPSRIPGIGRGFEAADHAFQSWSLLTRAKMFDLYVNKAMKAGVDITDIKQLESIGSLANNMSGRATLGRWESVADNINVVLFSPRFWASNLNFLTAHMFSSKGTAFTRKVAAGNLAKAVAAVATVMYTAEALGFETEKDPNSTNFGKIKIGESWVDVSGKLGSVIVLASRMYSGEMKTMSGKTIDLTSGKWGGLTRWDALISFAEGKTSPPTKASIDFLKGRDFNGDKPTILSTLKNLMTPMAAREVPKILTGPDGGDLLLAMILISLNLLGFSITTPNDK